MENLKETAVDFIVWAASSTPILIPLFIFAALVFIVIRKKLAKKNLKKAVSGFPVKFDTSDKTDDTSDK